MMVAANAQLRWSPPESMVRLNCTNLRAARVAEFNPEFAMAKKTKAPGLVRLTRICLTLPECERRIYPDHADFRVRGKVFAYYLNSHHGDGIVSVCCKTSLGENVDRVSRDPERFYLPAYIGPRGWFGLRLDRAAVDWHEVQNVVELSYRIVAPKSLKMTLDGVRIKSAGKSNRRTSDV
jgi:predicted DNA-binding protein (MmcQ/YjbR family)